MNHLLRDLAPVSEAGWELLDTEARERLTPALAARKLVDFSGPLGWDRSATNLGRVDAALAAPVDGVEAARRRVLPLIELRAHFSLGRDELAAGDRGAADVDLVALDEAAQRMARTENVVVFHGWTEMGIVGVTEASTYPPIGLGSDVEVYPRHVAQAVELLLRSGVDGPYGLALGPDHYRAVIETSEHGGYPLLDHLRKILGGPLVWTPGVQGAVVLSLRGGDFLFESGQDLAIGYDRHDGAAVHLYLEETFSFRVASADAAVSLTPSAPRARPRRARA